MHKTIYTLKSLLYLQTLTNDATYVTYVPDQNAKFKIPKILLDEIAK